MLEIVPPAEAPVEFTPKQKEKQKELHDFYAWEGRVTDAVANERQKWAKKPGFNVSLRVPSYQPWEAPDLSDEERQRIYAEIKLNKFYETYEGFSPAAHMAVHSPDAAQYLDDVKCDYLGCSQNLGGFKEISPESNHTPFDIQFKYDVGVINHYTESGTIVHVRETNDPTVKTREQKLFIMVANLMTGEVPKRLYADNQSVEGGSHGLAGSLNEIISLKTRHLSGLRGHQDIDSDNDFTVKYESEKEYILAQYQPKLRFQGTSLAFKPEGYGGYEVLHPIGRLDWERHLLGRLALQSGQYLNDRGAVEYASNHLSLAN